MRTFGYIYSLSYWPFDRQHSIGAGGQGLAWGRCARRHQGRTDALKWDAPHGAKLGVVASGSPAEKAGLKTGDIIDLADGFGVEMSSALEKLIAMNPPAQSCGCA